MDSEKEKCSYCGGKLADGYMYGDHFIAGNSDLKFAFRGKEQYLSFIFPSGDIPDRGDAARMCSRCFKVQTEKAPS